MNPAGRRLDAVQTNGLGNGLGVKAGRFRSGIGYANEQHPHLWDFSNAALPCETFFGPHLDHPTRHQSCTSN